MSYDYSENILVQESAGNLLQNELGWEVVYAYNQEVLGENGTFGRKSYHEVLLVRYFRKALRKEVLGYAPPFEALLLLYSSILYLLICFIYKDVGVATPAYYYLYLPPLGEIVLLSLRENL